MRKFFPDKAVLDEMYIELGKDSQNCMALKIKQMRLFTETQSRSHKLLKVCSSFAQSTRRMFLYLPYLSLVVRKPVFEVSDQAPHKPGSATTQDGLGLDISYIGSGGIVLSM